jgi:hypothetical protein
MWPTQCATKLSRTSFIVLLSADSVGQRSRPRAAESSNRRGSAQSRSVRVRRGALMTSRPHGAKLRALHREVHAHGEIITSGVGQARGALAG